MGQTPRWLHPIWYGYWASNRRGIIGFTEEKLGLKKSSISAWFGSIGLGVGWNQRKKRWKYADEDEGSSKRACMASEADVGAIFLLPNARTIPTSKFNTKCLHISGHNGMGSTVQPLYYIVARVL